MRPMIYGMPLALMRQIPEMGDLTNLVERQPERMSTARIVCKHLGDGKAMLAALAAHDKQSAAKTTAQNNRRLQNLLRSVALPPSRPRTGGAA